MAKDLDEQSRLICGGAVLGYFLLLVLISCCTSRRVDNATFFTANRSSPWFLVTYGMLGVMISGITFISTPGVVMAHQFSLVQLVVGMLLGFVAVAFVLLPLYYTLELSSIYGYLGARFGRITHKTASAVFIVCRLAGSSFRLYLAAEVLQLFFFDSMGLPFSATTAITLLLVFLYTFRSGIRTVLWTDTLQTTFLLSAAGLCAVYFAMEIPKTQEGLVSEVLHSRYVKVLHMDFEKVDFVAKQVVGGFLIGVSMNGLDQDIMQKHLTCKSLKSAQINFIVMTVLVGIVNIGFLLLGALMYLMADKNSYTDLVTSEALCTKGGVQTGVFVWAEAKCVKYDMMLPTMVINHLPLYVTVTFLLGLVAAAFSSADSALAALTTCFCVDIMEMKDRRSEEEIFEELQGLIPASLFAAPGEIDSSDGGELRSARSATYGSTVSTPRPEMLEAGTAILANAGSEDGGGEAAPEEEGVQPEEPVAKRQITAGASSTVEVSCRCPRLGWCSGEAIFKDREAMKRSGVHLGMTTVVGGAVTAIHFLNDDSVLNQMFEVSSYTYGPLTGLFLFGLTNGRPIRDGLTPLLALLAPGLTWGARYVLSNFVGYSLGVEALLLNTVLMYLLLALSSVSVRGDREGDGAMNVLARAHEEDLLEYVPERSEVPTLPTELV